MSRAPLIRQTKPEDLICKVRVASERQFTIENNHRGLQNWDREYVDFGGFFGVHGPHVFAAAPELLALVHQYRNDLLYPVADDSRERRLAAIDAVLAKAAGL